ncbi:protein translocase subunit SecF [Alkaliphilus sp. MSJ-5]|uniref:Protein-export membrane protein SecF n=1 Tax=Alkaliphilus flagellatus TaxID=2841507 RepID=A0ABS6G5R7_9FIRM|nr:protein translocase subunit SecF [Alkaliphilus flagellatus]MBU5677825.1 protein translocase subunit SecF [Alkaliphilus flagellatus]
MNIVQKRKIWFSISGAIMLLGLVLGLVRGINFGIDFTGGTLLEIELHKYVATEEIREIIDKYDSSSSINMLGEEKTTVQIRMNEDFDTEKRTEIFEEFKKKYNLAEEDFLRADQFGPSVGKEIQGKALLSMVIASIGMLIYITIRFEFSFAISAIIALTHDVLIVLAMYSILRVPVNSPFVAAILTILGYSINDTIVIFDRIRENLKFMKKADYTQVANDSISQTITRSINTSLTTLVTILALYILGVDQIREFALPLIIGVIAGTYSSVFIASPLWVMIKQRQRANHI